MKHDTSTYRMTTVTLVTPYVSSDDLRYPVHTQSQQLHLTWLRPVSNVVLLSCLAGSTVARLQHDLVSDVELNSVELKAVDVNMCQTITNRFCWLVKCIYNLWMKFDRAAARRLKPSRATVEFNSINWVQHGSSTTFETGLARVSRNSRNFSGAFRVPYFPLYLKNEDVSRHENFATNLPFRILNF